MSKFGQFIQVVSKWAANAGALLMIILLLVSCIDVIGANLFNWPVPGITEIVGLLQGVIIALVIARTQIVRRHVRVEFFVSRLPKRIQTIIDSIISPIILAFFVILTWQTFRLAIAFQTVKDYTQTLHMPIHPFVYVMAVAFIGACLVFTLEFINSLREAGRK